MRPRKWVSLWSLVLLLSTSMAFAGGSGAVRKQVESSLLATGTLDIERDGTVSAFTLDRESELPPVARKLMEKAQHEWKFQPIVIDGKAAKVRTPMSIRLAAQPGDEGAFHIRIASANFAPTGLEGDIKGVSMQPPGYPPAAARSGVRGTVYVVARVGRNGQVEDAMAQQVNLRVIDSESGMKRWRYMLESAAVNVAKTWTFSPPTKGDDVDAPFWLVRVPVDFMFQGEKPTPYGKWESYVPGPMQSAPWLGAIDTSLGADAMAAGSVSRVGAGPRLLNGLDEG